MDTLVPPQKILSICIPTFNFGRFIGETLDSIVSQMTRDVEIVILDGGSTDMTSEVVSEAQRSCVGIKYHRIAQRGGIDRDMARVVELADGQYCWLFSADDRMRPGALRRMLDLIRSDHDVYLCKHSMCTLNMKIIGYRDVINPDTLGDFDLRDETDKGRYFRSAQTTEAFFSFIGGIIVRRSKWTSIELNENFVGSCWAHVARLFQLIPHGLTLLYVPEVLLDRRGDNDSFADLGVVNRYRIAIDGYHRLADTFLGNKTSFSHDVRRALRNEFGLRMFLHATLCCSRNPATEDAKLLDRLIKKTYVDRPLRGLFIAVVCNLMPSRFYAFVRSAYRRFRSAIV